MLWVMLVGVTACLASLLATPLVRDLAIRWGLTDAPDQIRKVHNSPIPRLGGVAVFAAYVATLGLISLLDNFYHLGLLDDSRGFVMVLGATLVVFITGLADDLKGLTPLQKLLGQLAAACVAYSGGIQIHSIQGHALPVWLSLFLTIGLLIFCSNAFNLIDGLDGLAAGIALLAAATVFFVALMRHNTGLMMMTLPLCGALIGFLRYNFNPASIFLGDCGSLTLGFLLGSFGIMWSDKSATLLGMTAPVMALALPLLDASVSFLRRFLRSQPVFGGDRRHIHHRLLDLGMNTRRAVLSLYAVGAAGAALSLLQNALHDEYRGLVIVLFCVLIVTGIQYLGYVEFGAAANRIFGFDRFRKGVDMEVRLRLLSEKLTASQTMEESWHAICSAYAGFGFAGVRFYSPDETLEDFAGSRGQGPHWQIRIPLRDGRHLNFYSSFDNQAAMLASIPSFVALIDKCMNAKVFTPAPAPVPVRLTVIRNTSASGVEGLHALAQSAGSN